MLNQISKLQIRTLGLIYLIVGIALIAFSITIYVNPLKSVNIDTEKNKLIKMCDTNLKSMFAKANRVYHSNGLSTNYRYNISRTKDSIIARTNNLDAGLNVLKDADSILYQCKGLKMTYFCMGDKCENAKVDLKMEFNGKIK